MSKVIDTKRISQDTIDYIESYGFNLEPCSTPKNEWNRMKRNFLYNNFYNPYKNNIKNNRLYYFLKRIIKIKYKEEYEDYRKSFVLRPKLSWHRKIQFEFTITPPIDTFKITGGVETGYEKYYTVHFGKNYDITRHDLKKDRQKYDLTVCHSSTASGPVTITYSSYSEEHKLFCTEKELKKELYKLFKVEGNLMLYYRDNQLKKILNSLD